MSRLPLVSRVSSFAVCAVVGAAIVLSGCSMSRVRGDSAGAEFVGAWALADTEGDLFDVVVDENGGAITNWSKGASGARGERGEWTIVDGGAGITLSYDSGWRDVITRSHDGSYAKKSYAPGVPLTAAPSNAGLAIRVRGPVLPFVGVWQMTTEAKEEDGAPFHVAMKSDGTARKTVNPKATGTWSVKDGAAHVTWSDGWRVVIREEGGGRYSQDEWHPGATPDAAPTSRLRCHPVGGVPAAPPGE